MRFWIGETLRANDGSTRRRQMGGEGTDGEFGTSECYVLHTLQTESYHLKKKTQVEVRPFARDGVRVRLTWFSRIRHEQV